MSRWCLCDVLGVSRWRLKVCIALCSFDGVSLPSWRRGGASVVSAASMLTQGVHGVLVVSWWRRVGGVGAVVLVLGCVSVVFPCASLKS